MVGVGTTACPSSLVGVVIDSGIEVLASVAGSPPNMMLPRLEKDTELRK